jgi:hypothetical protein
MSVSPWGGDARRRRVAVCRNRYPVEAARRLNETKILFPSQYGTYILFLNGIAWRKIAPATEEKI